MKKYSEEEILEQLKSFYTHNGRPPTKKEFTNKNGYISNWVVIDRFGSWNNGLLAAGLDIKIKQIKNNTWDKEKIIFYTLEYITNYGKYPNSFSVGAPSISTIKRYFKNWLDVYDQTGFKKCDWTEELVLKAITDFYHNNNRVPTTKDFRANTLIYPSSYTINKFFNSWNNAISKAGLPTSIKNGYGILTKGLDGITYRSAAEAYFCDNYLYNNFNYEVESSYPSPYDDMLYDWFLTDVNIYIELDGGLRPETTKNKININNKLNRLCLFIDTNTIFDKEYIKQILVDTTKKVRL
jgi:hypothetical protein